MKTIFTSALICSALFGSVSFGMKKSHESGDTIDTSYRYNNGQCSLYTDRYRVTSNEAKPVRTSEEAADPAACLSRYVTKNGKCVAYSILDDEFTNVNQTACNPGVAGPDGWFTIKSDNGQWQIATQREVDFPGGKGATQIYDDSSENEMSCSITVDTKSDGARTLSRKLLLIDKIKVRLVGQWAQFQFMIFSEQTPDGKNVDPVKSLACNLKQGASLRNGTHFDMNAVKSFNMDSMQLIGETLKLPITMKPRVDR